MHAIEHTYVSLLADVARLTGFREIRGSYEGLQWCLNEAPKLEKLVLESVESGVKLDLDRFPAWLHRLARGSLVDSTCMRYLRQLLLFCYKASVTHDNETTRKAYQSFFDTNYTVGRWGNDLSRSSPFGLQRARKHCQSVLYRFRERALKPSHGPGEVTTSKEKWQHLYSTIEYLYPYSDWFSLYQNRDHLAHYDDMCRLDIISCRLSAVPKDSRGPRLICIHPAEAIWIQQGLRRELERSISLARSSFGPWPKRRIHFDDQSINGRIALSSSKHRRYATIDMKEASDRISEPLVQILFGRKYKFFGCCRAQNVQLKDERLKVSASASLHCYAPMGNATTFPVQSLVFWAICVSALQRLGFHQPSAAFVFGDDIIIPSVCVEPIIYELESYGLLVNRSKSFWRGAFRESCGVDAFNGINVTPVRWKTTLDADHLSALESLSDIAMRLRIAGYEEASITAYSILSRRLATRFGKRLFTTNNRNHGGIAEFTTNEATVWSHAFWHEPRGKRKPSVQWYCSPVWRLKERPDSSGLRDWNHVLESVTSLERNGRSSIPDRTVSRRIRLDRGWSPIV